MWAEYPYKLLSAPKDEEDDDNGSLITATHMVLVHNCILRTLNSIIIQAPHITPSQASDFIGYALAWLTFVRDHHGTEEEVFFPKIAEATGESDIMNTNIAQHHLFDTGMSEMHTYLASVKPTPETFSGEKLLGIIDSFAPALLTHLSDEIPTMLELKRFGSEKLDLKRIAFETATAARQRMDPETGVVFLFTGLDRTVEGGRFENFPPSKLENFGSEKTKGFWRFAPCTFDRVPKVSPEAGPEGGVASIL